MEFPAADVVAGCPHWRSYGSDWLLFLFATGYGGDYLRGVVRTFVIVPLSVLGSWLVYRTTGLDHSRPIAMAMLMPVSLLFDVNAKPPVYASARASL